jgi:3-hydroxyanthranilate 3,4-dioxygenase
MSRLGLGSFLREVLLVIAGRMSEVVNILQYVETIKDSLKPPVSNKLLYSGEHIKVMIVGGPNERDDFHVNKGEELFYQLIGDMNLDIMEGGSRKRIPIKQGQFFLLPSCVPHSPQRYANTIGIVFERERLPDEIDAMRWYVPGTTSGEMAFEDTFHCTDLGTQIKAAIEKYRSMQLNDAPQDSRVNATYPSGYFNVTAREDSSAFPSFMLSEKLVDSKGSSGTQRLISSEFVMNLITSDTFTAVECKPGAEVFLWQISGESEVMLEDTSSTGDTYPKGL